MQKKQERYYCPSDGNAISFALPVICGDGVLGQLHSTLKRKIIPKTTPLPFAFKHKNNACALEFEFLNASKLEFGSVIFLSP